MLRLLLILFIEVSSIYTENDLVSVMTATNTINNWNQLGLVLGLPHHVVDRIRQQYTSVQDHQQYILSHWIGTGCASWAGLVTALCSPLVNKQGLASEITRDHPCKCKCVWSANLLINLLYTCIFLI